MNFGQAIEALKSGQRVSRDGWNGRNMWLAYMPPVDIAAEDVNDRTRAHLAGAPDVEKLVDREGLSVGGYIVMWTAQGLWQPGWLASQADMMAEDWFVVSGNPQGTQ